MGFLPYFKYPSYVSFVGVGVKSNQKVVALIIVTPLLQLWVYLAAPVITVVHGIHRWVRRLTLFSLESCVPPFGTLKVS